LDFNLTSKLSAYIKEVTMKLGEFVVVARDARNLLTKIQKENNCCVADFDVTRDQGVNQILERLNVVLSDVHAHPLNHHELVYGRRLAAGEEIRHGDVCDGKSGVWVDAGILGRPSEKNTYYYVRPDKQII